MPEPDDDFIGIPEDDTPAAESTQPGEQTDGSTVPTPPVEIEGELLDNDEPIPDEDEPGEPEPDTEDGDAPDTPEEPETPEPEQPEPAPVAQAPEPVADPGAEFTPKNDYAFDIALADGSTYHVGSQADIDNMPEDLAFKNPAELMKAQANFARMTTGIEQEKRAWEADKEKFDQQQASQADLEARVNTMVAEMDYLQTKGRLPKVDPQFENADWSDPQVQKQPGVKERIDLLNYRAAENQERARLGLPNMTLLEAATQMTYDQNQIKIAEQKQKAGELRKARGAMVGGTGSSVPTNIPDDMIIGEGGSIRDINPAY